MQRHVRDLRAAAVADFAVVVVVAVPCCCLHDAASLEVRDTRKNLSQPFSFFC